MDDEPVMSMEVEEGDSDMKFASSEGQSRILQSASLRQHGDEGGQDDQEQQQPHFPKLTAVQAAGKNKAEYRRVRCPPHRYTPLREYWEQILTPLVEYLKLQVSMLMCVATIRVAEEQRQQAFCAQGVFARMAKGRLCCCR